MKTTKHKLNSVGLDIERARELTEKLNKLLATYQVYYQNIRGFHWNVRGNKFFELHVKFEELYTDAQLKIDEIAERILTLEATPFHSFQAYLSHSEVDGVEGLHDGIKMVGIVMQNLQEIIVQERAILETADEISDEGTSSMISDYISQQEKVVWMLRSYLG